MSAALLGSIDFGARRFEVVLHDLLYEKVDGIVNAANGDEENKLVRALPGAFTLAAIEARMEPAMQVEP